MKTFLLSGLLFISLPVAAVEKGASRETVLAELGEPNGSMQREGKEILIFKTGTVTLQNGAVTETDLSQNYVQQSEERAIQAQAAREARRVELEQQKRLYPEDHVIKIPCAYNKTEDWSSLPEFIRPSREACGYDVYIPPGYHATDLRHYPCLILESPALWNSVKERVRKEKWIVVVLHDATGQQIAKTLNGNFLAAYDDARERFRISRSQIFTVGRTPSAIFALLRPVAGIILQEPDFGGFSKVNFSPDFLRKNPELRAYVLLGNSDRDNALSQGQFIIDRIPKRYIGIYEGNTTILPQPLADAAIDWMKKECALP